MASTVFAGCGADAAPSSNSPKPGPAEMLATIDSGHDVTSGDPLTAKYSTVLEQLRARLP